MIRVDNGTVYIDGEAIEVSRLVYKSIALFIGHEGELISRDDYSMELWGSDYCYQEGVDDARIDTMIRRTRAVIGRDAIRTRKGLGYVFISDNCNTPNSTDNLSALEEQLLSAFRGLNSSDKYKALAVLKALKG